jgi:hypothetical protein
MSGPVGSDERLRAALKMCIKEMNGAASLLEFFPDDYGEAIRLGEAALADGPGVVTDAREDGLPPKSRPVANANPNGIGPSIRESAVLADRPQAHIAECRCLSCMAGLVPKEAVSRTQQSPESAAPAPPRCPMCSSAREDDLCHKCHGELKTEEFLAPLPPNEELFGNRIKKTIQTLSAAPAPSSEAGK